MTDDLVRRAAEVECEFGKGCDVPSKPCRCALMEDMVNRILELETAMREIVDVPLWDEFRCIEIARAALKDSK